MSLPTSLHHLSSLASVSPPSLNLHPAFVPTAARSIASGARPRRVGVLGFLSLGLALGLASGASSPARADELNACGCSQSSTGECVCTKQAKCGCPGMCEPVGCAAKREKEWKRELDAETKRAAGGGITTTRTREQEPKRASASEGANAATEKAAPAKTKVPQLTSAQERSLRRLLDAYVEAHPDAENRSLGEIRASLSASTGG